MDDMDYHNGIHSGNFRSVKDANHRATSKSYASLPFQRSFYAALQDQIIIGEEGVNGAFNLAGYWPEEVKGEVKGQPFVKITHYCPFGKAAIPLSEPRVFEADIHTDYIVVGKAPPLDPYYPFDIGMINLRAKFHGE
ncbi:hypothetical protein DdX_18715 [Ditylenchus destructor]|uniref:Uncharacterized protein n=1 Tax=Ditylenchus destructor TaxID=166010 RepID=A0AAD4MP09_9BILA|nr:hypothetical protein DdX_18715 [Ditylenchus destructor]